MRLSRLIRNPYVLAVPVAALAIVVMLGTIYVGIRLKEALGLSEGLPLVVLFMTLGALGLILVIVLVGVILGRLAAPLSWTENRKRYPQVKAAIEHYQKKGEGVRYLLPAYLIDGKRYFFVQYFPRAQEWAGGIESGILVLDDAGRVLADEALAHRLMTLCHYVASAASQHLAQERRKALKAGHTMVSGVVNLRRFLEARILDKLDNEARVLARAVLEKVEAHANKIRTLTEAEDRWANEQGEQIEYDERSIAEFLKLRNETSQWFERDAPKTLAAWRKLKEKRPEIERQAALTGEERRHWQQAMEACQAILEFTETGGYRTDPPAERMESYRNRLAWVREVDRQQKPKEKMEQKEMAG